MSDRGNSRSTILLVDGVGLDVVAHVDAGGEAVLLILQVCVAGHHLGRLLVLLFGLFDVHAGREYAPRRGEIRITLSPPGPLEVGVRPTKKNCLFLGKR